jgi:glucokinase
MEQFTIGIDVGGTKTAYGLLDGKARIIGRLSHPSNSLCSPEQFFDQIVAGIYEILSARHLKKENLRGVGIGMPSFILFEEGRIIKTSNLPNIRDFPARAYLMKKLDGVRVIIDNDAHTAAIAEHQHGAGRGFENLLYCPVSTGISTGIIINGNIFRGRYGWTGESGHMIVTSDNGIEFGFDDHQAYQEMDRK